MECRHVFEDHVAIFLIIMNETAECRHQNFDECLVDLEVCWEVLHYFIECFVLIDSLLVYWILQRDIA